MACVSTSSYPGRSAGSVYSRVAGSGRVSARAAARAPGSAVARAARAARTSAGRAAPSPGGTGPSPSSSSSSSSSPPPMAAIMEKAPAVRPPPVASRPPRRRWRRNCWGVGGGEEEEEGWPASSGAVLSPPQASASASASPMPSPSAPARVVRRAQPLFTRLCRAKHPVPVTRPGPPWASTPRGGGWRRASAPRLAADACGRPGAAARAVRGPATGDIIDCCGEDAQRKL